MDIIHIFLNPALVSIVVVLAFIAVSKLYERFNRPNITKIKSEFKDMSFGAIGALVILIVLNFQENQNYVSLLDSILFVIILLTYLILMVGVIQFFFSNNSKTEVA
jgi:hypothetical protein